MSEVFNYLKFHYLHWVPKTKFRALVRTCNKRCGFHLSSQTKGSEMTMITENMFQFLPGWWWFSEWYMFCWVSKPFLSWFLCITTNRPCHCDWLRISYIRYLWSFHCNIFHMFQWVFLSKYHEVSADASHLKYMYAVM